MWSDWYNYVAIPCVALRGNVESLWALEWKMSGQRRAAADVTEGKDFHHHLKHPQILSLMGWTKNSGLPVKSPLLTDHHFWTIQTCEDVTLTADNVRKWNNRPGQVWNTKTVMVKNHCPEVAAKNETPEIERPNLSRRKRMKGKSRLDGRRACDQVRGMTGLFWSRAARS